MEVVFLGELESILSEMMTDEKIQIHFLMMQFAQDVLK